MPEAKTLSNENSPINAIKRTKNPLFFWRKTFYAKPEDKKIFLRAKFLPSVS